MLRSRGDRLIECCEAGRESREKLFAEARWHEAAVATLKDLPAKLFLGADDLLAHSPYCHAKFGSRCLQRAQPTAAFQRTQAIKM
ncbi:MAG: hypothetical protein Rhirs2KO_27980 [Rhizobiaceae bacterium]